MKRTVGSFVAAVVVMSASAAFAQDVSPGPGRVEVNAVAGGGTFFTSKDDLPEFYGYTLGGTMDYNINRIVGIEGEVSGTLGVEQNLEYRGVEADLKPPHMLNYSGNVVVSLPTRSSIVPFATGGVGGMTMFEREELGVNNSETFLTGNAGGGLKWYAKNGRWGLRGDYRFLYVKGKNDAPAFFGADDRYGHRVYGAIIINALR